MAFTPQKIQNTGLSFPHFE